MKHNIDFIMLINSQSKNNILFLLFLYVVENSQTIILTEMLELYIIEIPKARKEIKETEREIMRETKDVLKQISEDEHERYLAHLREKYIREQKAIEEFGYDNGLENGIKQGIKRGIEQGIKQTTIEIAKQMLKEDIEIEVIKRITKLSEQEIKKLK